MKIESHLFLIFFIIGGLIIAVFYANMHKNYRFKKLFEKSLKNIVFYVLFCYNLSKIEMR
jgi:Na+/glutamate symporter